MEISGFRKSVQEIGKVVGNIIEEKLGDRSQLEEQVRGYAKMAEAVAVETVKETVKNFTEATKGMADKAAQAAANRATTSGFGKVKLRFKKLAHFKGDLPSYATSGASGMDVRACLDEAIILEPGHRFLVPTGLSLEIPEGYEVQVRPRSGLAIKKGISMVNTPGTVDADYRGEVKVIVINLGQEAVTIADQERIAQLVVCPVVQAELEEVTDLSETGRGAGGFGSTGV